MPYVLKKFSRNKLGLRLARTREKKGVETEEKWTLRETWILQHKKRLGNTRRRLEETGRRLKKTREDYGKKEKTRQHKKREQLVRKENLL